jgi:hypothetical protein
LTKTVSLQVGYAALYLGNLRYAEDIVRWQIPDMGVTEIPGRDILTETLYANIDLLR